MTHRLVALEATLLFRLTRAREPGYAYNGRQYCRITEGAATLARTAADVAGILVVWSASEDIVSLRTAWHWLCERESFSVACQLRFYGEEHWGARHYREDGRKSLYTLCAFLMDATSLSRAIALDRDINKVEAPDGHVLLCSPEQAVGGAPSLRAFDWDAIRDPEPARRPRRRRIRRRRGEEAVVRVRRTSCTAAKARREEDALGGLRRRDRAWLRRMEAMRKRINSK